MKLRSKLWLEHEGQVLFGHGRLELLLAIAETGSLAGAAKKMDMSYRAAWGRLKASEERLGFALVEHTGKGRRSTILTPEALALVGWFQALREKTDKFLRQAERTRPNLPGLPPTS